MNRLAVRSVAALGVALAACGCSSDQVRDLTADPMSSTTPAGADLVTSREEEERGGGLLGKPSPAKVLRTYAFDSEAAARRAMTDLRDDAEDAGWEVTSVAPDSSSFSAERVLDGRHASLIVALNLSPAFTPAPGVFVSMTSRDG